MKWANRAATVVASGLVLLAAAGANAARLPDWAKAIAAEAPAIPEGISEDRSRVLLSETRVRVEPNGQLRVSRRMASQALSPRAEEVGLGYFHFVEGTEIERSKAWHLPPEGKAKKNRGGALDVTLDDSFLTDQRTRLVNVDGIEKGSLVFFEFEATLDPHQLAYQIYFFESAPTDVMRFELDTPAGWSVNEAWLRQQGPEPQVEGQTRVWEMRDLEVPEEEPLGESAIDVAPLLVVNFVPPEGINPEPPAFPDWPSVATWFEDLAEGRAVVSDPVAAMAATAFADAGSGDFDRIRAAAEYVRDNVRYVAKEIGIGGFRPSYAGDVAKQLYGDCKDKGTLFSALLAADGRESYPVLINATLPETVSEEVPSLGAFNHFVIGVPLAADTEVPESYSHAVVEAGDLGRILVVDTTSELTPIGYLPAGLQGKTALVVSGNRSWLGKIPVADPSAHRVEKRFEAEMHSDSSVTLKLVTSRYGEPGNNYRSAFRRSEKDYRDAIEEDLLDRWPECTLDDLSVVEETEEGAFVETVTATIPPPTVPRELLALFPTALDEFPRLSLGRRETAVKYPYAMSFYYESTLRGVPESVPTPSSTERDGEGWAAGSSFTREGDTLRATWQFELNRLRFESEEFRDLKRLWSSARKTASTAVTRENRSP